MRARGPATPSPRSPRPPPRAPLCRAVFFPALAFLRPPLVRDFALARRKLQRELSSCGTRATTGTTVYIVTTTVNTHKSRENDDERSCGSRNRVSTVLPENFQPFQSSSAQLRHSFHFKRGVSRMMDVYSLKHQREEC